MRKLKLQVQITLDGCVASPTGEMEMFTWDWDDVLKQHVEALTKTVDTIVLGRKLADAFIPYWAEVAADPTNPEQSSGRMFTDTPKVVFSRTLNASPWPNTVIARDITEHVQQLKQSPRGDLIAYGGAGFVSSLIDADLIDEYHLFVNPVAIGAGLRIFSEGTRRKLTLNRATTFACGVVALEYLPKRTR
jgi:dihydrofolate reductase